MYSLLWKLILIFRILNDLESVYLSLGDMLISKIFSYLDKDRITRIYLMCISVFSLIMSGTSTVYVTVVVF